MDILSRRTLLAAAGGAIRPVHAELGEDAQAGIRAILKSTLRSDPGSHNTDWFGTVLMEGLLAWTDRIPEARRFATRWLEHHLATRRVSPYMGHRARTADAGGIMITTYAGQYGLAFPCGVLARMGDKRARRVCAGVASVILHQTARDRFGMVAHADADEFAIPDTCYFVVKPLMIADSLGEGGGVYREQALYQLRTYTSVFLDRGRGLAKTILTKQGIGKTYWTRASGWLLWAMTSMLGHLAASHPGAQGIMEDLAVLASGVARAQDRSGALPLYLDDPSSPLETTGTAMCAMGVHEAVRRGWLPRSFSGFADRAWAYALKRLGPDGRITGAYTGWAAPAENREIMMDHVAMGWIPGFMLSAAAEFART